MHQIRFRLGLRPKPHCMGELTALPQNSQLDFRGPTSKGRDDRGRVGSEGKGEEGRARPSPQTTNPGSAPELLLTFHSVRPKKFRPGGPCDKVLVVFLICHSQRKILSQPLPICNMFWTVSIPLATISNIQYTISPKRCFVYLPCFHNTNDVTLYVMAYSSQ